VPHDPFPGYTAFLATAARRIGRPEAEVPARRIAPLSALANLCAQASLAEPAHVPPILAKAAEFRDQLHAAFEAAELMLDQLARAHGLAAIPRGDGHRPGAPRAIRDAPTRPRRS
jgi:hypothetical protein